MDSPVPTLPPPVSTTRMNILAWVALAGGALGLALIAIPMQILAASQPDDIKLADEIRDMAREIIGKPRQNLRPQPAIQKWMPQLNAAGMTLAAVAVIVGVLAWARRDDWRIAAGGVVLGLIAMTIHFYLLALGFVLLIAIIYFASTLAG